LINKFPGCEREKEPEASCTEKTSWLEACGCAYAIVRSDGKALGPIHYRGKNVATLKRRRKNKTVTGGKAAPCNDARGLCRPQKGNEVSHLRKRADKKTFLDSRPVYDHNTGVYCGQLHRKCMYEIRPLGPQNEIKAPQSEVDKWIK